MTMGSRTHMGPGCRHHSRCYRRQRGTRPCCQLMGPCPWVCCMCSRRKKRRTPLYCGSLCQRETLAAPVCYVFVAHSALGRSTETQSTNLAPLSRAVGAGRKLENSLVCAARSRLSRDLGAPVQERNVEHGRSLAITNRQLCHRKTRPTRSAKTGCQRFFAFFLAPALFWFVGPARPGSAKPSPNPHHGPTPKGDCAPNNHSTQDPRNGCVCF